MIPVHFEISSYDYYLGGSFEEMCKTYYAYIYKNTIVEAQEKIEKTTEKFNSYLQIST